MHKRLFGIVVLLALLLALGGPAFAQSEISGASNGSPIAPENASSVQQLARYGRGTISGGMWTPDGSKVIIASSIGVWVYDAADLSAEPLLLVRHTVPVTAVTVSADSSMVASGDQDGELVVWDLATGEVKFQTDTGFSRLSAIAFRPDGTQIATAASDEIKLWTTGGAEQGLLEGHSRTINELFYLPDGATLASASDDNTVRLWDVASASEKAVLEGHTNSIRAMSISADGAQIATGASDRFIRLWDAAEGTETFVSEELPGRVVDLAFTPDGTQLVTVDDRRNLSLWNAGSSAPVWTLEFDATINGLALSPDGATIGLVMQDQSILTYNLADGAKGETILGHTYQAGGAVFNLDSTRIAAGYTDDLTRMWDLETGEQVWIQEGFGLGDANQTSIAYSPDGSVLASKDGFGVFLRNPEAGQQLAYLETEGLAETMAFSPDGAVIATGDWDGILTLWNVTTGAKLAELHTHTDRINSIAFSADGSMIVTASYDGSIRLWGVPAG